MRVLIPSFIVFLLLLQIITAEDIRINMIQNFYYSSDRIMTLWGSLEMEDIEILAGYNDSRLIVFKQSWSKGNLSNKDWMFFNMFLGSFLYYFQVHIGEISEDLEIKDAFTTQCMATCPSSMNDQAGYAFKIAVDGEEIVHLNVTEGLWVAGNHPYSKVVQNRLEKDTASLVSIPLIHC
ncbi:uncharacterized protein LOC143983802 [Lithobates pipiens]